MANPSFGTELELGVPDASLGRRLSAEFVGIAMLAAGMLWRLWARRGRPLARTTGATRANSIDGDFRVVGKAQLPMAR